MALGELFSSISAKQVEHMMHPLCCMWSDNVIVAVHRLSLSNSCDGHRAVASSLHERHVHFLEEVRPKKVRVQGRDAPASTELLRASL